jgi:hypothetical protein
MQTRPVASPPIFRVTSTCVPVGRLKRAVARHALVPFGLKVAGRLGPIVGHSGANRRWAGYGAAAVRSSTACSREPASWAALVGVSTGIKRAPHR